MKKDKRIQFHLDAYADAFEKKAAALDGAYAVLQQRQAAGFYFRADKERQRARRRRGSILAGLTAAAGAVVALVILLISLFPFSPSEPGEPPLFYSLSALTCVETSRDALLDTEARLLDMGDAYEKIHAYYTAEGNMAVLAARYRAERGSGIDTVIVYIDLLGGLTDVPEKEYFRMDAGGGRNYDNRENGEYYSFLYIVLDGTEYYLSVMSPNPGGGDAYEQMLIG